MRLAGKVTASIGLFVLAACASVPPSQPESHVRPLVSPASLGSERAVNQIVRGAIGTREMTINCVVTVKDGTMTVVGLSAMGMRLFTVRYDGTEVHTQKGMPAPEQLTPERLIADLQLVFWPLESLQKPLQQAGWQVSEPAPGTRRLRRGERLIAEAHYSEHDPWAGRSWLVNLEYGYSLQIDSKAP